MSGRIEIRIEERAGGSVAHVAINNQTKLNILNSALMTDVVREVGALGARDDLRALVLTGAGDKAFIGGADITEMAGLNPDTAEAFITRVHRTCDCLRALPVPVIARINGYCLGAGLEIAAACDIRLAAANAMFGMPEVKVGIPSVVEAALLPRLIGWGRTRDLLMFAENIDAETALRWGFVEQVAGTDGLDTAVERKLDALFATGPRAARLQKKLIREWEDMSVPDAVRAGIASFVEAWRTDEPARMMRSFIERRRRT
jgi:enoyl-CoA hydratase/carnithine racemase